MAKTYTLNVAGLTRELTICKVNDHMDIAAFIMLGDAELTVAAAAELLKKCPDFDILLTAEAKGIPLAHEMSRQSGKPYVCAVWTNKAIYCPFRYMHIYIVYNNIIFVGFSQTYGFHNIIHFVCLLYSCHYTKWTSLFSVINLTIF